MIPREFCIVCEKKINRSSRKGGQKERRGKNSVTCSKKCSRIYTRIHSYLNMKIATRIKNEYKKENDNNNTI